MSAKSVESIVNLCKRRGFIFQDSEIYGGLSNSWDYGPLGLLLKNNIKREWWKFFVQKNPDMVGVDSSIIMNPKVWEASGHIQNFTDSLVECKKCHKRFRTDHLLDAARGAEPKHNREKPIEMKDVHCPECGGELTDIKQFNTMFKTFIGATEDNPAVAYLRPELAAGMFTNFKLVTDTMRQRLPFGIAQQGRAFRNEITTGNFIFRTREFEIMEFEYFINPNDWEFQFERWLVELKKFWKEVMNIDWFRFYENELGEGDRAFYSKRTIDIEYKYPFGLDELCAIAYRGDHDLSGHSKWSGQDLSYKDPLTGEKFIPHVIEPTFGVDRVLLAVLCEHYVEITGGRDEEGDSKHEKEVVLRLPKNLAPIQVAILPLSKKEPLTNLAHEIQNTLAPNFMTQYDETGSIGKRYRRQDEIGTPFCVTVDFESLEDKKVTVRDRDTMKQDRLAISDLVGWLKKSFEI